MGALGSILGVLGVPWMALGVWGGPLAAQGTQHSDILILFPSHDWCLLGACWRLKSIESRNRCSNDFVMGVRGSRSADVGQIWNIC